jgi:hypothetical protein
MNLPPASSNGNPINPENKASRNPYIPTPILSEEFKNYMKREYPYSIVTRANQTKSAPH